MPDNQNSSEWSLSPPPVFGEWLRGIYASERNPQRDGMYVRTIRRTGRTNPGTYYELTDGKGSLWSYPVQSVERTPKPAPAMLNGVEGLRIGDCRLINGEWWTCNDPRDGKFVRFQGSHEPTRAADNRGAAGVGCCRKVPCEHPGVGPCDMPAKVPAGEAVAYLDIGVGGYLDLGTEKDDDELFKLPPGRHMLGIIGTHGVDGYKAQPAEVREAAWRHPDEVPKVVPGGNAYFWVAVRRKHDGRVYSFPAQYLNAMLLCNEWSDDTERSGNRYHHGPTCEVEGSFPATGWHDAKEHGEYDCVYQPLLGDADELVAWREVADYPATTPPAAQVQQEAVAWCSLKNGEVFRVGLTKGALGIDTPLYLHPAAVDEAVSRAYDAGFRVAANWMERDDLHADCGSQAYAEDKAAALHAGQEVGRG